MMFSVQLKMQLAAAQRALGTTRLPTAYESDQLTNSSRVSKSAGETQVISVEVTEATLHDRARIIMLSGIARWLKPLPEIVTTAPPRAEPRGGCTDNITIS